MNFLRAKLLSFIALVILVAMSVLLYGGLPETLPSQFSASGVVQSTLPKEAMVVIMPAAYFAVVLIVNVLLAISPEEYSMPNSKRAIDIILFGIGVLFCFLHYALLKNDGDHEFFVNYFAYGMAAFLIITGNVFGKTERNFFLGLRLPWTIASEANWKATHRLAGKLMVVMGILLLIVNYFVTEMIWILVISLSPLLIPVVYSFLYYNANERGSQSS